MSKPTLTYFDFAGGRGEDCRMALHLAGVDFVDDRVRGDWPERKPKTPFGALPTLEVPGRGTLSQSNAILTFIGRQHGLLPSDAFEAARHEGLLCAVEELRTETSATARKDEAEKKAARETFAAGYFQRWAANVSEQVQGPFAGGEVLSVADLKIYVALRAFTKGVYDHVPTDILDAFPKLTGLLAAVEAHPGVASWIAK